MARGVDLSALSRGERLVLAGSGLLFLNAFIPWWYRIRTPSGTSTHNAGLTAWGMVAASAAFLVAGAVLIRAARYPKRGPADGVVYAAAGTALLIALLVDAFRTRASWLGLWVSMALATVTIYGGWVRRGERRSGWI